MTYFKEPIVTMYPITAQAGLPWNK